MGPGSAVHRKETLHRVRDTSSGREFVKQKLARDLL